jgi:UDP-GlcNAc:undecaprenyl-phosphate GlcNAc-1-phosphate transferase
VTPSPGAFPSSFILYILAFFLAFLLSLYGTPIAAGAARKFGIVDRPDGNLKEHGTPIPYLGGLSIYLSFLVALSLVYRYDSEILALLLAGTIVVLLGLIDDFGVLTPQVKFLGQLIAVAVLMKSGILIHIVFFPRWLNLVFTVVWLVGLINAMNIIDIMDGLSAGVAVIAATFLLVVSILNGRENLAMLMVVLVGAVLGFLRYNLAPAKIYMGDTGAMFLGLMLGSVSMINRYADQNPLAVFNPILILSIPVFDTVYVMILRTARGKNPVIGSRDHFALRLRKAGLSTDSTVYASYGISVATGILALINMRLGFYSSLGLLSGVLVFFLFLGIWLSRIRME